MDASAMAVDGRRLGSAASLEKKLKMARRIPVYPEMMSVRNAIRGSREEALAAIEMLAEDGGMVCFLSSADKRAEVRRLSRMLKIRSSESEDK